MEKPADYMLKNNTVWNKVLGNRQKYNLDSRIVPVGLFFYSPKIRIEELDLSECYAINFGEEDAHARKFIELPLLILRSIYLLSNFYLTNTMAKNGAGKI